MEPFITLSFASLFSILPVQPSQDGQTQDAQMTITRHTRPEIAGLWEYDYAADLNPVQEAAYEFKQYSIDPELLNVGLADTNLQESQNTQTEGIALDAIAVKDLQELESSLESVSTLAVSETVTVTQPEQSAPMQSEQVCHERHNYAEDNQMWTVSGDEWTYGKYYVTPLPESLPLISILTVYDNNEPDCSGTQEDQTGQTLHAFLDYDKQTQQMRWCLDPDGNECFMELNRILP